MTEHVRVIHRASSSQKSLDASPGRRKGRASSRFDEETLNSVNPLVRPERTVKSDRSISTEKEHLLQRVRDLCGEVDETALRALPQYFALWRTGCRATPLYGPPARKSPSPSFERIEAGGHLRPPGNGTP